MPFNFFEWLFGRKPGEGGAEIKPSEGVEAPAKLDQPEQPIDAAANSESAVTDAQQNALETATDAVSSAAQTAQETASGLAEAAQSATTDAAEAASDIAADAAEAAAPIVEEGEKLAQSAAEAVTEAATEVQTAAKETLSSATDAISEAAAPIAQSAQALGAKATEALTDAAQSVQESAENLADAAVKAVAPSVDDTQATAADAVETASNIVTETAEPAAHTAQEAVAPVVEETAEAAENIAEAVSESAEETVEMVSEAVEAAPEAVAPVVEETAEAAESIAEAVSESAEEAAKVVSETIEAAPEAIAPVVEETAEAAESVEEAAKVVSETIEAAPEAIAPVVEETAEAAENTATQALAEPSGTIEPEAPIIEDASAPLELADDTPAPEAEDAPSDVSSGVAAAIGAAAAGAAAIAATTSEDADEAAQEPKQRPVLTPKPLGMAANAAPDLPIPGGAGVATSPINQQQDTPPEPTEPAQAAQPPATGPISGPAERPELGTKEPALVTTPISAPVSDRSLENPEEREIRMSDGQSILAMMKEKEVEYLDLRFTDPRGKLQHVTLEADFVDADLFTDGTMFDGSSIAGWKAINESDMVLMPDPSTAQMDPFYAQNTLAVFCDILEPGTGEPYSRDPRSTAKKAMAHLANTGIGDSAFFGPEAEFFVFDDVRFEVGPYKTGFSLDSTELMSNSGAEYETGNMGHRPRMKGGYFPVNPVDSGQDMRSEMLSTMKKMGVPVEKHHHEVASAQHELGMKFGPMVTTADSLQLYKYCIHNVAHAYGKSATFMPKPVMGDNGTGMHVHQSIWKNGQPLFAGDQYADLSEECLFYIGGILKHAKALNAFTNPSTNSYKRLIPGFEAPVLLAYSARNRSASCRIPYTTSPKGKRIETRFPDPTANPYLCFAALLMAGLDGIENKIHPGEAMDKDLYALPPEELAGIPTVCGSLREALTSLEADHEWLLKGGVFTKDQVEGYTELKWEEVYAFEHTPHPVEFDMYYSV